MERDLLLVGSSSDWEVGEGTAVRRLPAARPAGVAEPGALLASFCGFSSLVLA